MVERIVIGGDENQVTKFYGQGSGQGKGITAKKQDPEQVNAYPEKPMIYKGSTFQYQRFNKGIDIPQFLRLIT
jgi:hypothetical protein